MPYKFQTDKKKIPKKLDRRVKLSDDDKQQILRLRKEEGLSQRKLAQEFGVSRRTIQFILNPEKLEENNRRRAERGGSTLYYNKEDNTRNQQNHRRYKKQLQDKNQLI